MVRTVPTDRTAQTVSRVHIIGAVQSLLLLLHLEHLLPISRARKEKRVILVQQDQTALLARMDTHQSKALTISPMQTSRNLLRMYWLRFLRGLEVVTDGI